VVLREHGIQVEELKKLSEGSPNAAELIRDRKIDLIINTPNGKGPMLDEAKIRSLAVSFKVPCITTIRMAKAAVFGLQAVRGAQLEVKPLHDYHEECRRFTARAATF